MHGLSYSGHLGMFTKPSSRKVYKIKKRSFHTRTYIQIYHLERWSRPTKTTKRNSNSVQSLNQVNLSAPINRFTSKFPPMLTGSFSEFTVAGISLSHGTAALASVSLPQQSWTTSGELRAMCARSRSIDDLYVRERQGKQADLVADAFTGVIHKSLFHCVPRERIG